MTPSHGYAIEHLPGEVIAAGMHCNMNHVVAAQCLHWAEYLPGPIEVMYSKVKMSKCVLKLPEHATFINKDKG